MKRGLIFVGFFLIFLFVGVLLAAVFAGDLELKKESKIPVDGTTATHWLLDTANLKKWQTSLHLIEPTGENGVYVMWLNTGKPEKARMDLLIEADTVKNTVHYIMSNKGSELDMLFTNLPDNGIRALYTVKGKGIANKLVLAMLRKSFKEQYTKEFDKLVSQIGK